jgi:hypothetical protein
MSELLLKKMSEEQLVCGRRKRIKILQLSLLEIYFQPNHSHIALDPFLKPETQAPVLTVTTMAHNFARQAAGPWAHEEAMDCSFDLRLSRRHFSL